MVSLAAPHNAMAPPPITPKRPNMTLKRSSSFLDSEEARLPSSLKKLKVAFDPNIDVRIMDDWTDKSFELVREEVRMAIDRHTAAADFRDDSHYIKLLALLGQNPFSPDAPSSKLLQKYLVAVDMRISSLGECGRLAAAAMDVSWLGRDEAFVAFYIKYLCDLASAHSKFVPSMIEKLVSNFSKLPASRGRLPDEAPVSRPAMFARLHAVLRLLLRQIPSANGALMRLIKVQSPNDLESNRSYLQYQRNLLQIAEYAPELKYEILVLIVQRLVGMDVQIQQDIEDLEDDEEERVLQQRLPSPKRSADDDDSDDESVSETEESVTEDEQRLREVRLRVAKMDGTLDLLFAYYAPLIADRSRSISDEAFNQMLTHFTTFILPTRSRHAQFLLFHFAQASPAHTDSFVKQCLQLAGRDSGRSTHRLTALAYISSFVARGANLTSASVQETVAILCQNLEDIRRRYEPTCRGPDRRAYGLYYAVAQALLYIFCFRWRDLVSGSASPELDQDGFNEDDTIAEGRELAWLPGFKETMLRNIYCRLNPLKVCSQAIVGEFAKIAHHLRFLYVFPLLETNKRIRLGQPSSYYGVGGMSDIGRRETAWDRKKGEAHHQLEAYFPFDPYHLPKSKHWIAHDYNEWKLPSGMRQDEDDMYSDSEDEDESDAESLPEDLSGLVAGETLSVSS